jgi:type II secretory ATPase GspE/PulE/Tfp pilus assembly ATPase PilB-like protein
MKIGEYLISKGKLTDMQLKDALFVQSIGDKRLGDILIESGYINDADVAAYLAYNSEREFFPELTEINGIYPDKKINEKLGFGFLYDIPALIIRKGDIYYLVCGEITSSLSEKMAFDEDLREFKIGFSTKRKIYEALNKIFINKTELTEKEILNESIEIALLKGSPNLRVKRSENFYIIIMDTENRQENIKVLSLESGKRIINIIAQNCQITLKKGEGLDAKFIFKSNFYKGVQVNIRVAFLPVSSKLDKELAIFETVLRIHGLNRVFDFKSIGFTERKAGFLEKAYIYPSGLIISTGPTGSGKTTTFYAMLKFLSQKKSSIITIEDPVEIELREPNITQMNISEDFGYPEAIRVMLRSEPDIIMVGEIRDDVTAKYALMAGETGHLVLTTLHTNSSLSIFGRFKSLNVDTIQLFSVLRFVTAQRLYNPLCPACKKRVNINKVLPLYRYALETNLKFMVEALDKSNAYYGLINSEKITGFDSVCVRGEKNCAACGGNGYSKRKPVIEVAEFNDAVKDEIYRDLTALSNSYKLEEILTNLSDFESLKIQSFNKLIDGEIDPATYFNLSR